MGVPIVFRVGRTLQDIDAEIASWAERAEAGEDVASRSTIDFPDWDTFFKAITPNRMRILQHIAAHEGADSVRALALALGRDYSPVHRDCAELLMLGLLERRGRMLRCFHDPLGIEITPALAGPGFAAVPGQR